MSALAVDVGGVRVGIVEQLEAIDGMDWWHLSFDPDWVEMHGRRPVLGQWFEDQSPSPIQSPGPLAWFAHLLPQGPLRRAVARQWAIDHDDVFALLAVLGTELPGAVKLTPTAGRIPAVSGSTQVAPSTHDAHRQGAFRFALAGMQWKMSVRGDDKLVLPLHGEEADFIAKWPSHEFAQLPRIEHATMTWARSTGLDVPEVRLVARTAMPALEGAPEIEDDVFVIRRFDRSAAGRVHIEDLAQVFGVATGDRIYSARNYEHIAALLARLCPLDVEEFVRRLAFCLACGNGDAHLKNWSLIYPDGRTPRLAPAYDIVATVLYPKLGKALALQVGGRSGFYDITAACFEPLADLVGQPHATVRRWVVEQIDRASTMLAGIDGFSAEERRHLRDHLDRLAAR